jgi:hypothetical protein
MGIEERKTAQAFVDQNVEKGSLINTDGKRAIRTLEGFDVQCQDLDCGNPPWNSIQIFGSLFSRVHLPFQPPTRSGFAFS